jgi:hypothetical protein
MQHGRHFLLDANWENHWGRPVFKAMNQCAGHMFWASTMIFDYDLYKKKKHEDLGCRLPNRT